MRGDCLLANCDLCGMQSLFHMLGKAAGTEGGNQWVQAWAIMDRVLIREALLRFGRVV